MRKTPVVRQASRVLIVDDDAAVRRMLARSLGAEGYDVALASDGGGALVEIERSAPDLILLDVTMPGIDGLGVARRVRGKGDPVPILLLTARDGIADRVAGLDAGADDYLVKPFATDELLARVRALLRRGRSAGDLLSVGDVTLDLRERTAVRAGRALALTPREADLLELLVRNARGVVSREQALEHVWGSGAATTNVVDRYVAYLRRKLGEPPLIRTVRGVGFVFEP
jgi:two-component system, OmpR family, response regulator MprA